MTKSFSPDQPCTCHPPLPQDPDPVPSPKIHPGRCGRSAATTCGKRAGRRTVSYRLTEPLRSPTLCRIRALASQAGPAPTRTLWLKAGGQPPMCFPPG